METLSHSTGETPTETTNNLLDDFDVWVREVREPATYASEGPRRIVAGGKRGAECEYEIAPLPDGRWALRYDFSFPGYSGGSCPWESYQTREECVVAFRSYVLRRLDEEHGSCLTQANRAAIPVLRKIIDPGDLFGFQEPEPVAREVWYPDMIEDKIGSLALDMNHEILDVVRSGNYKPISKSGSFFDIPLPAGIQDTWKDEDEGEGEEPEDDDE